MDDIVKTVWGSIYASYFELYLNALANESDGQKGPMEILMEDKQCAKDATIYAMTVADHAVKQLTLLRGYSDYLEGVKNEINHFPNINKLAN